jgi:hypothetical protein
MNETCGTSEREEKVIQNFGGKPERRSAVERGRLRWKDRIKDGLKEIEWKKVDWIYLTQDTEK